MSSQTNPQEDYMKLLVKNKKLRNDLDQLTIAIESYKTFNKFSTNKVSELQEEFSQLLNSVPLKIRKSLSYLSVPDNIITFASTVRSTSISRSSSLKRYFSRESESLVICNSPCEPSVREVNIFLSFHLISAVPKFCSQDEKLEPLIPEILFSFPEGVTLKEEIKCKVLELAFINDPGFRMLDLDESMTNQVSEVIYQAHYRDGSSFVTKIEVEDRDGEERDLYGCFVTFEDLGTGLSGDQLTVPVCYCLLSFCPCFELHFSILNRMLDLKRTTRCDLTSKYLETKSISAFVAEDLIFCEEISLLTNYYSYLNQQSLEGDLNITIRLNSVEHIEYDFPTDLKLLEQLWCCPLLFSSLNVSDFYKIFCAVLQEKCVVFFSRNLDLLTSTVLAFGCLLEPFKWQFPLIPLMTKSQERVVLENRCFLVGVSHKHRRFLKNCEYWYANLDDGCLRACGQRPGELEVYFPFSYNLEECVKEFYVQLFGCTCYTPNEYQIGLTKTIVNEIQKFNTWVIDSLKNYCSTKDIMNFQIHKEIIKNNSGRDKNFFLSVFQTDMFTAYKF